MIFTYCKVAKRIHIWEDNKYIEDGEFMMRNMRPWCGKCNKPITKLSQPTNLTDGGKHE